SPPRFDSAAGAALRAALATRLAMGRARVPEHEPHVAQEPREHQRGADDEHHDREPRPQRPDAHRLTSSANAPGTPARAGARAASRAMMKASADAGSANSTAYSCHSAMVRPPSSTVQICVAHSSSWTP